MFYVLNAFSPNMIDITAIIKFTRVYQHEARGIFNEAGDIWEVKREIPFISAVGHEATAKIISNILYTEVPCQRTEVSLSKGDKGLIFTLSFRPEEGKVYDYLELCKLLDDGKIAIYYFEVIA